MNRPQLIRRLRIATSVFFAAVTVALCVLWVRSYWRVDNIWCQVTAHRTLFLRTTPGKLTWWYAVQSAAHPVWEWKKYTYPTSDFAGNFNGTVTRPILKGNLTTHLEHVVPLWIPSAIALAVAFPAAIGLSNRFSLRTLLVVTTLVAVVLGLGVWAAG